MVFQWRDILKRYGLFVVLIILIIASAIMSPLFLTPRNLVNLLTQASFIGILAIGMTVVVLTAGIDLSISSIVGFASIFFATLLHGKFFTFMPEEIFVYRGANDLSPLFPVPFNLLTVLIAGAFFGVISGTLSYKLKTDKIPVRRLGTETDMSSLNVK